MTIKEQALFDAAKSILLDECPPDTKHYFCWNNPDDTEEPRCTECWMEYLDAVANGKI